MKGFLRARFWLPNDPSGSKYKVDFIHTHTLESGTHLPRSTREEILADVIGSVEVHSADAERPEWAVKARYKVGYEKTGQNAGRRHNFIIMSNNSTITETYGKMFSKTVKVRVVGPIEGRH